MFVRPGSDLTVPEIESSPLKKVAGTKGMEDDVQRSPIQKMLSAVEDAMSFVKNKL